MLEKFYQKSLKSRFYSIKFRFSNTKSSTSFSDSNIKIMFTILEHCNSCTQNE